MWYPPYDVFSVLSPDGMGPHFLQREVNVVPPVRCFFRTKARWNGSTSPSEGGGMWYPPYDVFSVLRPDGLGPHFLPREGECGTPRTMFFPY